MTANQYYEYTTISLYMDEKSNLVFYMFDQSHSFEYFQDALNYMGSLGWKLINSTDFIGTNFKNIGIVPLFAENYRSNTQTELQLLTFIRQTDECPNLDNNYFAQYAKKMAPIKEREEKIANLKELATNYFKNKKKYHLLVDRGDTMIFSIPGTPIDVKLTLTETDAIVLEDGKEYSILDDILKEE